MQIVDGQGKIIEYDCEYFADENIPIPEAAKRCFDDQGCPKCPVFKLCWTVYTRRRDESEV